ncbi:MAG: hypothetical protein MdMp014T_2498 [Treponematales bacterium]
MTESSTGHTAAINAVVTAKSAIVASVVKYAPPSPKGRSYYEGRKRIAFSSGAANTYTTGRAEGGDAAIDSSGRYVYTDSATGTYSVNEAAKTVTLTPEKIGDGEDEPLTKAEWKTAYQARLDAQKTKLGSGYNAWLQQMLDYYGVTSESALIDAMVDLAFAAVTYGYSFSDDGKALFLEQALPANKGTNELSGKTLHSTHSTSQTYVFAAGGTYTYTDSRWGASTITTGNYAVSLKWVYLQPVTVGGKTRAQYYETVGESGDSSRYPSAEDYRAGRTNSAFGLDVYTYYDLTAGVMARQD